MFSAFIEFFPLYSAGGTCFDSETMWPVIVGVVGAIVAVLVSACWLCVNYPAVS